MTNHIEVIYVPFLMETKIPRLDASLTYNNGTNEPVYAGTDAVVATIDDRHYADLTTSDLVIAKATAIIKLENLSAIHDGSAKEAPATTNPADLTADLTYEAMQELQ